ncbi:hypothetical protein C8R44DRAFT_743059 [Mycena epipterygia]|nr:hypothetical protein C8R44DRAFT_743059 [Mycena epipterygia]
MNGPACATNLASRARRESNYIGVQSLSKSMAYFPQSLRTRAEGRVIVFEQSSMMREINSGRILRIAGGRAISIEKENVWGETWNTMQLKAIAWKPSAEFPSANYVQDTMLDPNLDHKGSVRIARGAYVRLACADDDVAPETLIGKLPSGRRHEGKRVPELAGMQEDKDKGVGNEKDGCKPHGYPDSNSKEGQGRGEVGMGNEDKDGKKKLIECIQNASMNARRPRPGNGAHGIDASCCQLPSSDEVSSAKESHTIANGRRTHAPTIFTSRHTRMRNLRAMSSDSGLVTEGNYHIFISQTQGMYSTWGMTTCGSNIYRKVAVAPGSRVVSGIF